MNKTYAWQRYDASNATRDSNGWLQNCWVLDREKTAENWLDTYQENGVLRWKSNNAAVPADCCNCFEACGFEFDRAATDKARDKEIEESCRAYRTYRERHGYSEEEMFEMRAAFGEGAVVVDMITGKEMKL